MMIGGTDIIIETKLAHETRLHHVVMVILRIWPNAVIEDSNTGKLLLLEECFGKNELFVYKDIKMKKSWDKYGWTPYNCESMISLCSTENLMFLVVENENDTDIINIVNQLKNL